MIAAVAAAMLGMNLRRSIGQAGKVLSDNRLDPVVRLGLQAVQRHVLGTERTGALHVLRPPAGSRGRLRHGASGQRLRDVERISVKNKGDQSLLVLTVEEALTAMHLGDQAALL